MKASSGEHTHWIADICGRDDARVEENRKELDDGVEVEEHQDLLATCSRARIASICE